jgi:hypothetical protein
MDFGCGGRLRLISVPTMTFPPHKAVGTDGRWFAFGCLDVGCTVVAVAALGSGQQQAEVLFLTFSTLQQLATSIQTSLAQGGQRLLGRKVLTNRIDLPQMGHCISAAGNGWAGGGGPCLAGVVAQESNWRTLLSASRRLGLKKP